MLNEPISLDPKAVFTPAGYERFHAHLSNMEEALFHIRNESDDLVLGDYWVWETLERAEELVLRLKDGPFLTREDLE